MFTNFQILISDSTPDLWWNRGKSSNPEFFLSKHRFTSLNK